MYRITGIMTVLLALMATTGSLEAQERLAQLEDQVEFEESVALLERPASLEVENVPLQVALTQLGYAAGVGLAFSPSFLPEDRLVSCDCGEESLGGALDRLLDGTGLRYNVIGKQIVVEKAGRDLKLPQPMRPHYAPEGRVAFASATGMVGQPRAPAPPLEGAVEGIVVDAANNQPLGAVQISFPGLNIGTLSSADGRFGLSDVPAGTHTIRAELLGYRTLEHSVEVASGETVSLELELREQAIQLDAVVVTGTGRETRTREMGTSVGQISSGDFANAPVRNPEDILMGREAGVTVQLRSGQPGAMGHITLRGATSVSAERNQPLIYVDGVRLYSHGIAGAQNARQGVHALQSVSAADIDRIEVVRGAAASTLYGSEAAAGVIQIFTKQGQSGAPVWEVELTSGLNSLGHVGPGSDPTSVLLNCSEEMTVLDRNSWEPVTMRDPTCPSGGSWIENGVQYGGNLSVRGGSDDFSYFLSGRHGREEGVVAPGYSENSGVRGNFDFSAGETLSFSFNSAYSTGEIRWIPDGDRGSGFFNNVLRGPASHFQDSAACDGMTNPPDHCLVNNRILSHQTSHQWTDHFTLGGTARWAPRHNLNHRFTAGYDYIESLGQEIIEFGFHRPARFRGRLINRDQQRTTLSLDYVGSWTLDGLFGREIGSAFSWGLQMTETQEHNYFAQADDFAGPGLVTMTDGASNRVRTDNQTRVINPGFFLQEAVSYNDRLYLTLGIRIDGHSAFGSDFGFQAYPKIGASYVLSDEDFWPSHLFQTFRVRGAIGEAGQAPGAFDATRMWSTLPGPGGQAGFTPDVLGNPDLGPERTREVEVGFEGTTLDDRLAVELNVYWQNTSEALVGVLPVPSQGFLSRQLENIGEIRNQGFELSADWEFLRTPAMTWSARGHYSRNESEAIDLGGEIAMSSQRQQIREGFPVPSYFGPRLLNPNEFADPIYSDEDEYLGPSWPVNNIGVGTTLSLRRGLTFDAQGEFQGGHLMQNNTGYVNAQTGTWQPCFDIQRALATNDQGALSNVTARERVRCAIDGGVQDPFQWLEDGDFFKLRVVSLTYEIPEGLLPGFNRTTVTLSGRNLFESTDYTGLSVEANQGSGPNVMTRRDHYQIPPYRTFQLSFRASF